MLGLIVSLSSPLITRAWVIGPVLTILLVLVVWPLLVAPRLLLTARTRAPGTGAAIPRARPARNTPPQSAMSVR